MNVLSVESYSNLFSDVSGSENNKTGTQGTNGNLNNGNGNGSGLNSGSGKNKDLIVFILILIAFLLVVGVAAFGLIHNKKNTFRQCNDKKVLAEVKSLLVQHPNFTKYNFGINPKKPFTISDITEFAPANATIHKRYCEALINNTTSINTQCIRLCRAKTQLLQFYQVIRRFKVNFEKTDTFFSIEIKKQKKEVL
jgi:flagellar basal body-associated protein FliL